MAIDNNTYPHVMALGAPLNSHIHGIDTKLHIEIDLSAWWRMLIH
tara:strand:- start:1287 stop:1421 length:135 start_codon:yes stop_codon:yes gene_type:complete